MENPEYLTRKRSGPDNTQILKFNIMITVKYYASLKTIAGKEEDRFNLGSKTTVQKLSKEIDKSSPELGEMVRGKRVLVSVNHDIASMDTVVNDGDEVALLPPFSGGL